MLRKFLNWFYSLQKSRQIAFCVLTAHMAAILWMSIDHWVGPCIPDRHPIFVRTMPLSVTPIHVETFARTESRPSAPVAASIPAKPSASAKKKDKAPIAASTPKKSPRAAKSVSKNAPQAASIPTQTIREIEQSLSAISSPQPRKTTTLPDVKLPARLEAKSVIVSSVEDTFFPDEGTSTYHVSLVESLQRSLQLPEVGEVRVKITINAPGTIASVQILDTRSAKNSEWLKNQLPLLELPCFNDFGIVDAFLEFTIMFRNVENF